MTFDDVIAGLTTLPPIIASANQLVEFTTRCMKRGV
jgi:hypothetical protein